jgi:hypothetical protein
VDIRIESEFPPNQMIEQIRVLTPPQLVASKVVSYRSRFGQAKSWTDRRDLTLLLQKFPELKVRGGEVDEALDERSATADAKEFWLELVDQEPVVEDEDNDLNF